MKELEPRTHSKTFWDSRLAHALRRLAARRGNAAEARKQVAESKRILDADSAMAAQQARFYPYLVGYVARFTDDLATPQTELTKALSMQGNTNDPFLHVLLGMVQEKKGDAAAARALFQKGNELSTGHNAPAAFARPFTRRKLGL